MVVIKKLKKLFKGFTGLLIHWFTGLIVNWFTSLLVYSIN
jgi:hypothetical protein